jgi:hypothetical protein
MSVSYAPRVDLADRLRVSLLCVLAPEWRCAKCGTSHEVEDLEVDHIDARDWSGRALSRLQRAKRYWSEFLAGVRLRALCRSCNAIDGNHRRWSREDNES